MTIKGHQAMRGPDTYTEGLFTMRRLDDFVPANQPLRHIRVIANEALVKIDTWFSATHESETHKVDLSFVTTMASYKLVRMWNSG